MYKNHYEILEVSPNASAEIIRVSYKKLVQRYHPDKNEGSFEAENRLKLINQAFFVLSDQSRREAYDKDYCVASATKKDNHSLLNEDNKSLAARKWAPLCSRMAARGLDYLICSSLVILFLTLAPLTRAPFFEVKKNIFAILIMETCIINIWSLFIEPVLLLTVCTTPGKWFFDINLRHKSKISIREFPNALFARCFTILKHGLWLGIPGICIIPCLRSFKEYLNNNNRMTWDLQNGFIVEHGDLKSKKVALALLFLTVLSYVSYKCTMLEHENIMKQPLNNSTISDYQTVGNLTSDDRMHEIIERAQSGDAVSQTYLGSLYLHGKRADTRQAFYWYRLAGQSGNPVAQYNLAEMYLTGNGIAKDVSEGTKWLHKAASNGNPEAQNELGEMFFYGEGVPLNYSEAARLFKEASASGWIKAEYNLALCYTYKDCLNNTFEAYKWFVIAYKSVNQSELNKDIYRIVLEKSKAAQEHLSKHLTDDERLEAQKQAESWLSHRHQR